MSRSLLVRAAWLMLASSAVACVSPRSDAIGDRDAGESEGGPTDPVTDAGGSTPSDGEVDAPATVAHDAAGEGAAAPSPDTGPPGDGAAAIDSPMAITEGGTLAANGAPCSAGSACASGSCADGLCCDTACAGQCEACGETGTRGKCVPVTATPRSGRAACAGQGSTCGATCNGTNRQSCTYPAAEKECATASCQASTAYARSLCDGKGACAPQTTVSCGAAGCAGSICAGGCSAQNPCAGDQYCNAGKCFPKQAAGTACVAPESCQSGKCTDGVCCNVACDGACEACINAKTGGADGSCLPVPAGKNPDRECPDDGASTCGTDGTCDGARACHRYVAGTACAAAACNSGAFHAARACDGKGVCAPASPVNCGTFACFATGCRTSCSLDADCLSPNVCVGGSCGSRRAQGVACTSGSECASGACVDNVCCENACPGSCKACRQTKTGQADGLCRAVSGGLDPDNECTDQGASSCGTDGTCDGAGGCRKYGTGTPCGATMCSGSSLMTAGTCNGQGTCGGSSQDCSPYACTTGGCKTSCSGVAAGQHADCAAGFGCGNDDGKCRPLTGTWANMGYSPAAGHVISAAAPDPSGSCVPYNEYLFKVATTPMGLQCHLTRNPTSDPGCAASGKVGYVMTSTDAIRDCAPGAMTWSPYARRMPAPPGQGFDFWCLPDSGPSVWAGCYPYPSQVACDFNIAVGRLFLCLPP